MHQWSFAEASMCQCGLFVFGPMRSVCKDFESQWHRRRNHPQADWWCEHRASVAAAVAVQGRKSSQGEKNTGFDVLYHNMKHGQLATKELVEFVRERAAVEETYSKSMCKLSKIASNGSPQGKMNDLIRDINKYGEEQGKIHRKTKEEVVGTLEAVQGLQAELKSKKAAESLAVCIEKYNRVGGEFEHKMSESAQKFQDIEEAHLRQMKQLIKGYSHSIEDTHVQVGQVHEEFKQNVENIGVDNLLQKFAEQKGTGKERPAVVGFEEYMPALVAEGGKKSRGKAFRIPGLGKRDKEPDSTADEKENNFYSSDSDFDDEEPKKFHIQIRPVASSSGGGGGGGGAGGCRAMATRRHHRRRAEGYGHLRQMKQLIKGYSHSIEDTHVHEEFKQNVENIGVDNLLQKFAEQKGTGKERPAVVGFEEYMPALVAEGGKKSRGKAFRIPGPGQEDKEPDSTDLAVIEALGERDRALFKLSRLSSTASGSDSLFGPPLDSAFKSKSFVGREQLREQSTLAASDYGAFSSDSSSPENVEDSGLDSPSHQPLGPSPEPMGWVAWPPAKEPPQQALGRPADPFLSAFRDPSPGRSPQPHDEPAEVWPAGPSRSPWGQLDADPPAARFPAFSQSTPAVEASLWNCKHIPASEDPFLAAFERTVAAETVPSHNAWPAPVREGHGRAPREGRGDPFSVSLGDNKTLPLPVSSSSSSKSSSNHRGRERRRDRSMPPPVTSDDPFAITMIGSPTHQSSLAVAAPAPPSSSSSGGGSGVASGSRLAASTSAGCLSVAPQRKELLHWNSVHNPFSDGASAVSTAPGKPPSQEDAGKGEGGRGRGTERRKHRSSEGEPRRNAPPLTRHSGPQEDLCFSTDKDQDCLDLSGQPACSRGPHQGSKAAFRQDSAELLAAAPPRPARSKRTPDRPSGCERSRSLCSSPLPDPSPPNTSSSSSSPMHLSRGPSPISLSTQEAWPVAAAITEYINAYFKGGQHNRCLVKITGDLTMSFPAGFTRIFTANPNTPVLSFRLVNISRASYYNVGLLKYQVSSQDPGRAPLLLSAECQRSGTVTRVSLDYHCCPATAPSTQLAAVQVLLPLDHTATDLQCQPPATW
ncbi:hypothetical protein CRUP_024244 [Coryphaenoides rupestris]|nr:hypothetical protein CRUP_024244 [Coryphaenoides rupestris]